MTKLTQYTDDNGGEVRSLADHPIWIIYGDRIAKIPPRGWIADRSAEWQGPYLTEADALTALEA